MDYYPIHLDLNGKKTIIIGGGKIAERKISGLLEAGAKITVVSPELTDTLIDYAELGKIMWKKKLFSAPDIQDAFLIIAAANRPDVNLAVKAAADPNQLISLIDNVEESNFILPSVIRKGKLTITVSTSGASPILAKKIKNEISALYGLEYIEYVEFLFSCRKWIIGEIKDPKRKQQLLTAITDPSFLHSIDRQKDFKKLVDQLMGPRTDENEDA